jgi:hypothetical protein
MIEELIHWEHIAIVYLCDLYVVDNTAQIIQTLTEAK